MDSINNTAITFISFLLFRRCLAPLTPPHRRNNHFAHPPVPPRHFFSPSSLCHSLIFEVMTQKELLRNSGGAAVRFLRVGLESRRNRSGSVCGNRKNYISRHPFSTNFREIRINIFFEGRRGCVRKGQLRLRTKIEKLWPPCLMTGRRGKWLWEAAGVGGCDFVKAVRGRAAGAARPSG